MYSNIFSVTLRYPNMLFPFAYLLDCIATLMILLYFITVLQESVVLCGETQILSAFCFYLLFAIETLMLPLQFSKSTASFISSSLSSKCGRDPRAD